MKINQKKMMLTFICCLLVTLIINLFYIKKVDQELYFYGASFVNYQILPFGIKPEFNYYMNSEFELRNSYDLSLINVDTLRFFDTNVVLDVKKIVKYGYKNDNLVVLIEQRNRDNVYISLRGKVDEDNDILLHVQILGKNDIQDTSEYTWVDIDNQNIEKRNRTKNRLIVGAILQICVLIVVIIVSFNQKR